MKNVKTGEFCFQLGEGEVVRLNDVHNEDTVTICLSNKTSIHFTDGDSTFKLFIRPVEDIPEKSSEEVPEESKSNIKLFQSYCFPNLSSTGGKSYGGVWNVIAVSKLNTKDERWTLKRVMSSSNDDLIGEEINFWTVLVETFGYLIPREVFGKLYPPKVY